MSCLNPISIKNPKYRLIPFREYSVTADGVFCGVRADDSALLVPCGKCVKCLKRKRTDICFRLTQEYLHNPTRCFFITLTLNDDSMKLFKANPKKKFRQWFEHLRYKFGKSIRHFIVSELGSTTHRLHFHGILFNIPEGVSYEDISSSWNYGFSYIGYVNSKTISYVSKYITKPQLEEDWYIPFTLSSNRPGIGEIFIHKVGIKERLLKNNLLIDFNGRKIPLPRYYFNKIFTKDERYLLAKEKNEKILSNPDSFIFRKLQSLNVSNGWEYLSVLRTLYKTSVSLGQSRSLTTKTILSTTYGTFESNDDSSTAKRVKF